MELSLEQEAVYQKNGVPVTDVPDRKTTSHHGATEIF